MSAPSMVHIVTKSGHQRARRLGAEIVSWLSERGVAALVREHCRDFEVWDSTCPMPAPKPSAGSAEPGGAWAGRPDLLLVLGGDGTLISVARGAVPRAIPVLGVNLGTLGFLTRVLPEQWPTVLEGILANGPEAEERMILSCEVLRKGQVVRRGMAINDLVISRGAMARLIRLRLSCDGDQLFETRADGLILASPTGSTAYLVSAGGPIIHPRLEVIAAAAICPFMGFMHSVVLPARSTLEAQVVESWGDNYLTEDGQNLFALEEGDVIRVTRAEHGLMLVRVDGDSTFQALREKGFTRG